jgi:hypothetical protein
MTKCCCLLSFVHSISHAPSHPLALAGRYLLSNQVVVSKSYVVLRGAGQSQTTLYYTRSFAEIYGNGWGGEPTSPVRTSDWKSGPGMLRFTGPGSAKPKGQCQVGKSGGGGGEGKCVCGRGGKGWVCVCVCVCVCVAGSVGGERKWMRV